MASSMYACACVCVLCELCLQLCRSACDFMCSAVHMCCERQGTEYIGDCLYHLLPD